MVELFTALFLLLVGSITDFRSREVPDWLSYFGMVSGFGFALLNSYYAWSLFPLLYSFFGFVILFSIGSILYYSGQWGGGDAKVFGAIGALLGIHFAVDNLVVAFLCDLIIIAGLYGLGWSIYFAWGNRSFSKSFRKGVYSSKRLLFICLFFALVSLLGVFYSFVFAIISLAFILLWLGFVFAKSVESCCMMKLVSVKDVTEGDWLVKDVKVGKKVVHTSNIGLSLEQLSVLRKFKGKVLIKYGMPFIPCMLISFLVALVVGNIFLLFVGIL